MRFTMQKDAPRPLARCGATVASGRDARWRGVHKKRADRVEVLTAQRREEQRLAIERCAERRT